MFNRILRRLASKVAPPATIVAATSGKLSFLDQYIRGGRIPWSPGYAKFKNQLMIDTIASADMMRRFAEQAPLPDGYGPHIDERCVEIPWSLANLKASDRPMIDAGSVLNEPWILAHDKLTKRELVIWSLIIDQFPMRRNLSFVHGDFRKPLLRSGTFDSIVCISTLEHVGMWPIPSPPFAENLAKPQPAKDLFGYRSALATFRDLLIPGGQLLLTLPYGYKEDQDWLQIFDSAGVDDVVQSFGGEVANRTIYSTSPNGWQVTTPEAAAGLRYYNFVKQPERDPDMPAAARAVVCLDLRKPH